MISKTKLLLFVPILLLSIYSVLAITFQSSDRITIPRNQTIDDDLYVTGGQVNVEGTVDGDLVVVGGNVNVSGNVKGDLIAVGGQVDFDGEVTDDVRVLGGEIQINGKVNDDLIIMGGQVEISRDGDIKGSVYGFSWKFESYGNVWEDIKVSSGEVILSGKIKGDLNLESGEIHVLPDAKIWGNLNYTSSKEARIDEGAEIKGDIYFNKIAKFRVRPRLRLFSNVFGLVSSSAIGIVLILLLPSWVDSVVKTLKKPFMSGLIGFVSLIIIPICLILIFITIIGIPIALIGLLFFILALYLSKIFTSIWIGDLILRKRKRRYGRGELIVEFLIGLVILTILFIIPLLGGIFKFLSLILGYGAIINFVFFVKKRKRI